MFFPCHDFQRARLRQIRNRHTVARICIDLLGFFDDVDGGAIIDERIDPSNCKVPGSLITLLGHHEPIVAVVMLSRNGASVLAGLFMI